MSTAVKYSALVIISFAAGWLVRERTATTSGITVNQPTIQAIAVESPAKPFRSTITSRVSETEAPSETMSATNTVSKQYGANRLVQDAIAAQDDPSRAVSLFKEALSLNPKSEYALSQYSNFLVMNHDCEAATAVLKACVQEFPKNQLCQGNLTNCVFDDPDSLDLATQDCLKSDPKNMMCLNNRGQLYLRRKNFTAALSVFQQMEELNSHATISFNDGVIDESLALAYEGVGNLVFAANYYSRGCKEGMTLSCKKTSEFGKS